MTQWLWPHVKREDWQAELVEIERVTRSLLLGKPTRLNSSAPDAFAVAAHTSGMGPLLGYWLERDLLSADARAEDCVREHLAHGRARMASLGKLYVDLCGDFERHGVQPVVLKGMHTAHAYFPEPATRPVADVDVLVDDAEAAAEVLRAHGFYSHDEQYSPRKTEWRLRNQPRVPSSLLLTSAGDPIIIDVHTSLERNFFGVHSVPIEMGKTEMRIYGERVHVLAQPTLTLLLALHASEGLHNLRMIRLVELALVLRRDSIDWKELLRVAEDTGALRFVYPALLLTEKFVPQTVPDVVIERLRAAATPAMRSVFEQLTPANAQAIRELTFSERWMWAGTPWERLRRGVHLLWPAPAGRSPRRLAQIYMSRFRRISQRAVE